MNISDQPRKVAQQLMVFAAKLEKFNLKLGTCLVK